VDRSISYFWDTSFKITKLFYKFSKKLDFRSAAPYPSVVRSKFTVSQNNSFSRQVEDLMTMETTQVVIPDPEVVPQHAHSLKNSVPEKKKSITQIMISEKQFQN
jgi:hypothetical protein